MKINTILQYPFHLMVLIAGLTLSSVYFIEHILGHPPCILCLYQRLPWFGLTILALLGWRIQSRSHKLSRLILLAILCLLIASMLLAGYHTGVEFQWFPGPSTCGGITGVMSNAELKEALLKTPPIRCDEVSIRILGGSMALWNTMLSFILSGFIFFILLNKTTK